MKRFWSILAALAVWMCMGGHIATASADWIIEQGSGETPESLILATEAEAWQQAEVPTNAEGLAIKAKGAVLMELSTGALLFEQNSHEKLPIASVTKIMTMLLIMEAIDSGTLSTDDVLTCSATAAAYGGSQIWLEEGEQMSVHDLLKAIAVVSANDACAMVAEHLCGSVEAFVARMNARAAELGMTDTQFKDCSGLDDTAYSSAADVAIMSRALMQHDRVTDYTTIWMDTLRGGESQLVNTNKLVRYYKGATGLKTGTTAAAGHCLSATAERDGVAFCAVVLGCATTDDRFGGARQLLDYGFANYSVYTPVVDAAQLVPVKVLHGVSESVPVTVRDMTPLLLSKGEELLVDYRLELAADVEAPVLEGQKLGTVRVLLGESVCAEYPLVASEAVDRLTLGVAFRRLLWALIGG